MLKTACLIFNPVAGQGNAELDLARIRSILEPDIELEILLTSPDFDTEQLARQAIERGVEALIASGGDGTVSAVAEATLTTGIPLGIIARGTANAFATALGIPLDLNAACLTILTGMTKKVDAALCNGKPMVLLAGIGFEAETVEKADRSSKERLGMLAYVLAGLSQLREMERFGVEIETGDRIIRTEAVAVTVANVAPPTSILAQGPAGLVGDDGLLDITIVAPANVLGAIAVSYNLLSTALSGEASLRDDVGYLRSDRARITTDPPQKVVVDGEIIGTTPIDVSCLPGALTIFVPFIEEPAPVEKLEGLPNLEIEPKE